jgi:hypothetical protein
LPQEVLLNEVKADPPGTDGNFEFVELVGPANQALDSYMLVALEADATSGNPGQVDIWMDWTTACDDGPCSLGANGLLLLAAPFGHVPLESATSLATDRELAGGALENGSLALLLVRSNQPLLPSADWDGDDDCELELPTGLTLSDGVGWLDADAGDCDYVPPLTGARPPDAASRYGGEHCEACPAAWLSGTLTGSANSVDYSLGQALTPGGPNPTRPTPAADPRASPTAGSGSIGASMAGQHMGGGAGVRLSPDDPGDPGPRIMVIDAGTGRWSSPSVVAPEPDGGAGAGGTPGRTEDVEPSELSGMGCGCRASGAPRRVNGSGVAVIALVFVFGLLFRPRGSKPDLLKPSLMPLVDSPQS